MADNRYYAKLAIMLADGQIDIMRFYDMAEGCPSEIYELAGLMMDMEIYENSDRHIRLNELSDKYITTEAIQYEVW